MTLPPAPTPPPAIIMHIGPLISQPSAPTRQSRHVAVMSKASMSTGYPSTPTPTLPPPLLHHKSPYACVPLPMQLDTITHVAVHPVLRSGKSMVHYNLRSPPSLQIFLGANGSVAYEPATTPPLPSLTIVVPNFPWSVTVHASLAWGERSTVSVGDVLMALHRAMKLPAAEDVVRDGMVSVNPSLDIRRTDAQQPTRAIRRLDYLNGRTTFAGLSPSSMGQDIMIVDVR